MNKQLQTLQSVTKFMALLIVVLFVWNLIITSYIVIQNIQIKEDKFNQQVCIEELVPMEELN